MGSLFRSEDMSLCQLYLQAESAYGCVSELGELGIVQFKDLNCDINAFQRKFVHELRRCEEMERQLRYFELELTRESIDALQLGTNPEAPAPRDMVDLEATYENLESELKELNASIEALRRNHLELKELQYVLKHTEDFFAESSLSLLSDASGPLQSQAASGEFELNHFSERGDVEQGISDGPSQSRFYLGYVAGVIPRERLPGCMRLLWFASRGNIFIRHTEIEEPLIDSHTGESIYKEVFIAFFQGEQLKAKVKKICEGFKATLYPCSESSDERREVAVGVHTRLQDLDMVLQKSQEQKLRLLSTVAQNWNSWNVKVLKIKAIYHTMNKFHAEGKNYIAECFVPTQDLDMTQMVINRATEQSGSSAPSIVHPIPCTEVMPTYNRTNKFTLAFQHIIDAYGVANYKEVNAAPFAIITFPFLFSVMFGDFGHGILLFLIALWMVVAEDKLQSTAKDSEMFGIIFAGRYIVLLMGAFSIYSGLIYNDCFSKSFNIFGSGWSASAYDNATIIAHKSLQLDANDTRSWTGNTYPFGQDPVWQISMNKISFTNSFKKKISVIIGIAQMLLGVMLSICNHVHFKQYANIFCEFIPQLLFLMGIFGYLCALVFTKWVMFSAEDPNCAPNILIGFINMFLFSYKSDKTVICSNLLWYPGQKEVQISLVIMALVCAIWMLLSKPILLYLRNKPQPRMPTVTMVTTVSNSSSTYKKMDEVVHVQIDQGNTQYGNETSTDDLGHILAQVTDDTEPIVPSSSGSGGHTEEAFIHQAIHTIEYCLGCVSHTASYLRLWALSLAHSQLSEVLWNMVMRPGLQMQGFLGAPMLFVVVIPFAFLTVAILLLMEGLSAFLHTLRLHWVEFQSKFYNGDGIPFNPFSFKEILEKGFE